MITMICPICRDSLSVNQIQFSESRIVAGECGHVFHKNCLCKWVDQETNTAKRCPCCRSNLAVSRLLSLFPTFSDASTDDSSSVEINFDEYNAKIEKLNAQISTLSTENQENLFKIAELQRRVRLAEEENKKLEASCQVWIKRSEEMEKYKQENNNLQAKCERLETILKTNMSVDRIPSGKTYHVPEVTSDCCVKSTESLSYANQILLKELQATKTYVKTLEAKFQETKTSYLDLQMQFQQFISS